MKPQLQYPVYVMARDPDLRPLTLKRDDGVIAYPVLETKEEADRLAASRGLKSAIAIDIRNPTQMRGALLLAAKRCNVTTVLLPRGTAPDSGDASPEFPLADVLRLVDEQIALQRKAGMN